MVGLKEAIRALEKWNQDNGKLTADDIIEIAAKMTSAGMNHRARQGPGRIDFEARCKNVLATFQAAEGHKLNKNKLKVLAGHRPYGTTLTRLKEQGWSFELQHEMHGNRAVTFYVLLGKSV